MMNGALLEDRGVIEVGGSDAGALLQRLVTNDVLDLEGSQARYAALLTPQGKILADFLAVRRPEGQGFWLDCPASVAPDLTRKLTQYRLRAQVMIADRSGALCVAAFWPDRPTEPDGTATDTVAFKDPRHEGLGWRLIAERPRLLAVLAEQGAATEAGGYRRHRILCGIPEAGSDFAYGETFPHEANLDRLRGLDFKKGCYVGQEVVSRVEHRGTARKRIVAVAFEGAAPSQGAEVLVDDIAIGSMGSSIEGQGLAMLRTDRAAAALAEGAEAKAEGVALRIALP